MVAARLAGFFKSTDAFGYAIYGHTDSRASAGYNQRLSRASRGRGGQGGAVDGAVVEREIGFGESAADRHATPRAAGMQKNRRVEVVCYRWSEMIRRCFPLALIVAATLGGLRPHCRARGHQPARRR